MRDGWQRVKLGDLFAQRNERLGESEDEPPVFAISKYEGVIPSENYHARRVASDNLSTYKVLRDQDWAYSTIHIDEGSIGRNDLGHTGVLSPMYTTLEWISGGNDARYVELLLRTPEMLSTYRDLAQGSINRRRSLPWKTFCSIEVDLPPLTQQRRIVDLIAALDETIEASQLHHAALSATASGLRDAMPAGETVRLGAVLDGIDSGTSTQPLANVAWDDHASILKVSAVRPAHYQPDERKAVDPVGLPTKALVTDGDLLMTRSNTPDRVGFVAIARDVKSQTYMPDLIWRLRPDTSRATAGYLEQALSSSDLRAKITAMGTGTSSSMRKINKAKVSGLKIPLPSLTDQEKYVDLVSEPQAVAEASAQETESLKVLRLELLTALLSGAHEVPEAYDGTMEPELAGAKA